MSQTETKDLTLEAFVATDDYQEDDETDAEGGRDAVLEGGARYRGGTAQDDAGNQMDVDPSVCQNCGVPVTIQVRRVFGDRDNVAWACFDCHDATAVKDGAAASGECGAVADESTTQGGPR